MQCVIREMSSYTLNGGFAFLNSMKFHIILLFFCLRVSANNDSLKHHRFYIHTVPSNLLMGVVSPGLEHLYKKQISHEFQAYLKCFSPVFFKYDQGFRLNYQVKYNVINRSHFRMSVNLSTSYKKASFTNKKDYWFENGPYDTDPAPTYLMDRKLKQFGTGGGIGLNFKLSRHFFIGSELLLELCKTKKSYTVLEQENYTDNGVLLYKRTEPYVHNGQTFSGFTYALPVINVKLSYLF